MKNIEYRIQNCRKPDSRRLRAGSFVLMLVVLCALGYAKPAPPSPEARQKLEALRIRRLTQELNLTEDQSAQFFPKLKLMRELRQDYREQHKVLLKDLGAALHEPTMNSADVKRMVDSLDALDEGYHATELRMKREFREILTLEQQAKLYVFQATFEKETRQMIQKLRGGRRGLGGNR
jgi:Spy/CpxP family protein refolding chaperone